MPYITSLDDVTTEVYNRVVSAQGGLGLRAVFYADNNFTPNFPNAVVAHGRHGKERHTTGNRFLHKFSVFVYVLHADMTLNKAMRTKADIVLAEALATAIEGGNFSLGNKVVDCYAESIEPAMLPGRQTGKVVVSSRITMYASSVG